MKLYLSCFNNDTLNGYNLIKCADIAFLMRSISCESMKIII